MTSFKSKTSNLTVFILFVCLLFSTGCDRGFGHALAIKLDQLGFKVFAGCLDKSGDGAAELKKKCSNLLHILQLDVSNRSQIDSAFETVTDNLENYSKC